MPRSNNLQSFIDSRKCKPISFETVEERNGQIFLDSLRPLERKVAEKCFESGGFVAGGCPRYVSETIDHTGAYDDIDADAYRQFGDVDFFFPDPDSLQKVTSEIISRRSVLQRSLNDNQSIVPRDSRAMFAHNIEICEDDRRGKALQFQLISCQFGDPQTILSKFDFLNSMIAFLPSDGSFKTMRATDWLSNERSNTLNVLVWDSPLSFYRIQKYVGKYGYQRLKNGIGNDEQLMKDMSKAMETLPFDPERKGGMGWSRGFKSDGDGDVVFTQQNYAWHIMTTLRNVGHVFSEDVVVFMLSLIAATGVADGMQCGELLRSIDKARKEYDPKKVRARAESWKESKRAALAAKLQKQTRQAELYGFSTTGTI